MLGFDNTNVVYFSSPPVHRRELSNQFKQEPMHSKSMMCIFVPALNVVLHHNTTLISHFKSYLFSIFKEFEIDTYTREYVYMIPLNAMICNSFTWWK